MVPTLLRLNEKTWSLELDDASPVARAMLAQLPLQSVANNIGGEIYFRTAGVDIPYDGTQADTFQPGDITYWRSPTGEEKYAIALFYGNTQYSDWTTPKAASPCVRLGRILGDVAALKDVSTGDAVLFGGRP